MKMRHWIPLRARRGFSLAEIIVAMLIIAILAAMVYPTVAGKLRDSRTSALSQTFVGFSQGIAEYKRATTRYPGSLTLLTTAPVVGSLDICGNAMTATLVALWRGPYASRMVLAGGLTVGDATIQPGLRRVVSGSNIFLMIDAPAVETSIANDLEAQLDAGAADFTTGSIRAQTTAIAATSTSTAIAAAPTGTTNVSYAMPINSC